MGENREKILFVISRNEGTFHIDLSYKIIETDLKKNASLRFPTARMLAPIFLEFCRFVIQIYSF